VFRAGCWWLTPVILATQETEISTIQFKATHGQTVCGNVSQKKNPKKQKTTHHKKLLAEWLKLESLPSKCQALSSNPSATRRTAFSYHKTFPSTINFSSLQTIKPKASCKS
jgi:hypothetical protein